MAYTRINWVNSPSTATPINAANLNKMDSAIASLDTALGTKANQTNGTPTWDFSDNTTGFSVTLRKTGNAPERALGLAVTPSGATAATIHNLILPDGSRNYAFYSEYTGLRDQLNNKRFVSVSGLSNASGHSFLDIIGPLVNGNSSLGFGYYWDAPIDSYPGDGSGYHEVLLINEGSARAYSKIVVFSQHGTIVGRILVTNGAMSGVKWEQGSSQPRKVAELSNSDIYATSYVSALSGSAFRTGNMVEVSFSFTGVGTTKTTARLNVSGVLPTSHSVTSEPVRPRCVCRIRTQDPDAATLVAEMMGDQIVILYNGVPGTYCGTIVYTTATF